MEMIRNGQSGPLVRAYAVYYVTAAFEEVHTNGVRVQVPWSLAADMLDANRCVHCVRWQIEGPCPGLRAHAARMIARQRSQIRHHQLRACALWVPAGLKRGELTAEVTRQLIEGEPGRLAG